MSYWEGDKTQSLTIMDRGTKYDRSFVKAYYFYAWDSNQLSLQKNYSDLPGTYELPQEKLINFGLSNLLSVNDVVQIAPAGHLFRHPSGRKSKIFIQAREMARIEPELAFISNSLCFCYGDMIKQSKIIYIDTMGIYHFVREAIRAVDGTAQIKSFHSYDDLGALSPPIDHYLCIISASTTGGMASDLVSKQGFDSDRIVTLIDVTRTNRLGKILVPIDSFKEKELGELADGNGAETAIELVGEQFSSKAKPPRAVTLGVAHKPKTLGRFLKNFAVSGVDKLNIKPFPKATDARLICLNVAALPERDEFNAWLRDEISWSVSMSTDCIIHTDDETSKRIAESVGEIIREQKSSSKELAIVTRGELFQGCIDKAKKAKGVLVITAIAGDGGVLRDISRDLREIIKTEIPRHFLVAVGMPQSEESWTRLRQFLEKNPSERNYGFSNWLTLPVGYDGKGSFWDDLKKLTECTDVMGVREIPDIDHNIVGLSLNDVARIISDSHQGFLPNSAGEELRLTEGFVFFQGEFEEEIRQGKIGASAVFATIAAAVQFARELKDKNNRVAPSVSSGYFKL